MAEEYQRAATGNLVVALLSFSAAVVFLVTARWAWVPWMVWAVVWFVLFFLDTLRFRMHAARLERLESCLQTPEVVPQHFGDREAERGTLSLELL
jgi:Flp pilus assembly protein TadB